MKNLSLFFIATFLILSLIVITSCNQKVENFVEKTACVIQPKPVAKPAIDLSKTDKKAEKALEFCKKNKLNN